VKCQGHRANIKSNGPATSAASLAINSSGMVSETIVLLLTPEEIDKACKKSVAYRAPGA
jgi:hypothetical protein